MAELKDIVSALHKINFDEKEGIIRPIGGGMDYDFCKYYTRGKNSAHLYGDNQNNYCAMCEQTKLKEGQFYSCVSHGTHTYDFLEAHTEIDDGEWQPLKAKIPGDWCSKPVVFVMENPAGHDGDFRFDEQKQPSKYWYWLDNDGYVNCDGLFEYSIDKPNYFKSGQYGKLIYSIIKTFHLGNAYVTNMVKCGIVRKEKYVTTDKYRKDIVETCIKEKLHKEIECLKDSSETAIVFALGERTFRGLRKIGMPDGCKIYYLPHPRKATNPKVIFGIIYSALNQNGYICDIKLKENLKSIYKYQNIENVLYSDGAVYASSVAINDFIRLLSGRLINFETTYKTVDWRIASFKYKDREISICIEDNLYLKLDSGEWDYVPLEWFKCIKAPASKQATKVSSKSFTQIWQPANESNQERIAFIAEQIQNYIDQ